MARASPAASERTRPPAVVKAAEAVPAGRNSGWATVMLTRQTARVTANKPWGGIFSRGGCLEIFSQSNLP